MKKIFKWIVVSVVVCVLVATIDFVTWRYQQIRRLESDSNLVQTSSGMIEYATIGSGSAVLVLHGTLGGYDQAQMLAQKLDVSMRKFIFVSRPGYLRTPLATGVTFEEQADAYAALLDELGIDQVAVMATSGGGPSALQFALRYPDRCRGMILIAANSDVKAGRENENEQEGPGQPPVLLTNILLSDLTSWIIVRATQIMPGKVLAATVGADYVEAILNDPGKYRSFAEYLNSIALLGQRRAGTLNDGNQFLTFTGYPFENITTPTLILYGTEDSFVPFGEQVYLFETLPNSEYIEIEGGTHFMVISHDNVLAPLINEFLNTYEPVR